MERPDGEMAAWRVVGRLSSSRDYGPAVAADSAKGRRVAARWRAPSTTRGHAPARNGAARSEEDSRERRLAAVRGKHGCVASVPCCMELVILVPADYCGITRREPAGG